MIAIGPPAPVTFPDGLVARVAAVERLAASAGAHCDPAGVCGPGVGAGRTLVRVTIALGLPSGAPGAVRLDVVAGSAGGIALTVGAVPAAIDCGYVGDAVPLCTDISAAVPTVVRPGGEVRISESFDVPEAGLAAPMSVAVQPPVADATGTDPLRATTFEHVELLLR
jgi:hypothetical protein